MGFSKLSLSPSILQTLEAEGYVQPTPIQAQAIPLVLAGKDVLGVAQTGTGKTAAFAVPIIHRLMDPTHKVPSSSADSQEAAHHVAKSARKTRALILSPTRELAGQIEESFKTYGRGTPLRVAVIYGGVSAHWQIKALHHGVDVIVATPGRLLDLMNQGYVDLRFVQTLVLDEADQMLDMGFIHDIRKIVAKVPAKRQTLLFSATMPEEIRRLADTILKDPETVQVTPVASTVEKIEQAVYFVDKGAKPALLVKYLNDNGITRALVFTRTKHGADKVAKHLERSGIPSKALHGNKTQGQRKRAMEAFTSQRPPILVATDIAARGLDIESVSHVVNYDIPNIPETYVHRIGRTGRAGASGSAVSFCGPDEHGNLADIQRLIKQKIPVVGTPAGLPTGAHANDVNGRRDRAPQGPSGRPAQAAAKPSHAKAGGHGGHRQSAAQHAPRPAAQSHNRPAGRQGGAGVTHSPRPAAEHGGPGKSVGVSHAPRPAAGHGGGHAKPAGGRPQHHHAAGGGAATPGPRRPGGFKPAGGRRPWGAKPGGNRKGPAGARGRFGSR
jgi:ATP-dependent RNA helicase RhlE